MSSSSCSSSSSSSSASSLMTVDALWEMKPLTLLSCVSATSTQSARGLLPRCFELSRHHWSALSTLATVLISALPYILFLLVYGANELVGILPNSRSPCLTLYNVSAWESALLPFSVNRLIASGSCPPLDVLSAVPYLGHYVLPVVYPLGLVVLAGRVDCAQRFYRLVGWAMWIHYVIWYMLPTAPPWFYDGQSTATPSRILSALVAGHSTVSTRPSPGQLDVVPPHREGAAFARVDAMTGVGFFHLLFAGNPVPFAAFPSGHVTWPTCIVLTLPASTRRWPAAVYVCVVAWATMYSSHHYLFDVLAALLVVVTVDKILNRLTFGRHAISGFTVAVARQDLSPVHVSPINGFQRV